MRGPKSKSTLHDDSDAGLERIMKLEALLAGSPANSLQRRQLVAVIRAEAAEYRKSLDSDQAARRLDRKAPPH
jgi:hypothetical protein